MGAGAFSPWSTLAETHKEPVLTILVTTIWGGRVSVVVDRQISRRIASSVEVVTADASKALTVRCKDALFTIAYTGVATAKSRWIDEVIADCLAFKSVKNAWVQPSSFFLSRPVRELLKNLAFNLPIHLRSNPSLPVEGLKLAVSGWHLGPHQVPFICELRWTPRASQVGGSMSIEWQKVAKFLRNSSRGIWLQTWGDTDHCFLRQMNELVRSHGLDHDGVERWIVDAVVERSRKTATVGSECIALQLDPKDREGHVQVTCYPNERQEDPSLQSGWLLTPSMISAPTRETPGGGVYSPCGRYITGGYFDPGSGVSVRTRLPSQFVLHGGPSVLGYSAALRERPPEE